MKDDKVMHSLAVAKKMVEIGREEYNLSDDKLEELFVLGYNHDIGYEFANHSDNNNHNVIGGKILKKSGYKYWKEVYYHGVLNPKYKSKFLDILNKADLQIDKFGVDVGYEKRLKDIKDRYGEDSDTYKVCMELVNSLNNSTN